MTFKNLDESYVGSPTVFPGIKEEWEYSNIHEKWFFSTKTKVSTLRNVFSIYGESLNKVKVVEIT